MPTLRERGYLYDVSIFPEVNWTEYTMKVVHLPTGLFVQGEGDLLVEGMCSFYEKLFKKLAVLVEWRRLVRCPR